MDIFIGNTAAKSWHDAPVLDANGDLQTDPETDTLVTERKSRRVEGSRVTTFQVPVGTEPGEYSLKDLLTMVSGPGGVVDLHFHEKPVFVAVPSSQTVQDLLAQELGCASGVPDDWDGQSLTDAAAETEAARQAAEAAAADAVAGAAVTEFTSEAPAPDAAPTS